MPKQNPVPSAASRRAPSLLSIRGLLFLVLACTVCAATLTMLYGISRTREATIGGNIRMAFRAAQGRAISTVEALVAPMHWAMLQSRALLEQGVVTPGNREGAIERIRPIAAMLPRGTRIWLATPSAVAGVSQEGEPLPTEVTPQFTEEPWYTPAITRLTERSDRNFGPVTAYALLPGRLREGRPPCLVFALALGEPDYLDWVVIEVPTIDFLVGLDDLLPTVNGYVTLLLPDGTVFGMSGYTAPLPAHISQIGRDAPAVAYDLWAREKERVEIARRVMVNDRAWWAAFIEHDLQGGPTLSAGVLAPESDLTGTVTAMEERTLRGMALMLLAALLLTFIVGRVIRRPLLAITARMQRHDAHEIAYRYWPRTVITELNELMQAIDEFTAHEVREPATPTPVKAFDGDGEQVPQAQLQALYATRRRMRAFQQRVQALESALREIEREQPDTRGEAGVGMLQFLAEPEERVLLVADATGRIRTCAVSPELQERYETDFADVPGRDVSAFFAARHAQGREALFYEARDSGEPRRGVFCRTLPRRKLSHRGGICSLPARR